MPYDYCTTCLRCFTAQDGSILWTAVLDYMKICIKSYHAPITVNMKLEYIYTYFLKKSIFLQTLVRFPEYSVTFALIHEKEESILCPQNENQDHTILLMIDKPLIVYLNNLHVLYYKM